MTLHHGPILQLAASHEQQHRLATAERSRRARSAKPLNTYPFAQGRVWAARGLAGPALVAEAWFTNLAIGNRIAQP